MNAYSKVFAFDAATGNMKWQRSAIGTIQDIYAMERINETNVALLIGSSSSQQIRIAEYFMYFHVCLELQSKKEKKQIIRKAIINLICRSLLV